MKIKILNRNLEVPDHYDSSKTYEIDEGAVFTECYNETLDTGTIIISNQSEKIELEPYDVVVIYRNDDRIWKYMCVDTYTETMTCINPRLYKYEISLFSETKQLETVVLPNLKITKVWGETRSIYSYIDQYMAEYAPKVRKVQWDETDLLTTVYSTRVSHEDQKYYCIVTLTGSRPSVILPKKSEVKASVSVDITLESSEQKYAYDNNCEILSSYPSVSPSGGWSIDVKVFLGEFESDRPTSATVDGYTVYLKSYDYTSKIEVSHYLLDNFDDDCPEMQWNQPTLREVLNDLMMVKDCIPIVKDGALQYIDLTKTKGDVTNSSYINYITRSKSSEDFVSELQVNLENVTNTISNVNKMVTRVEYVPFMVSSDQVAVSENNCFVKTKYPIYKLNKLIMMFPGQFTVTFDGGLTRTTINEWMEQDLCAIPGLVTEHDKWITREITYYDAPPSDINDFGNTQNWSLYYTRGSNRIENFFNKSKLFIWVDKFTYSAIQEAIIRQRYWVQYPSFAPSDATAAQYYQTMFKVEYETLEGCVFRAGRTNNPDNDRIVIDNQTNSYVDSYAQGNLEYQKANRLGNEQLQINARYPSSVLWNNMIQIGNVYEDSIIYQTQYQIYKNHIDVNAVATKNYVLREYFTGVKSKIRSWAIASGSEALTRRDLNKIYCEFSYNRYRLIKTNVGFFGTVGSEYFVSPLVSYTAEPLKYVAIKNYSAIDHNIPIPLDYSISGEDHVVYYCLDLITRIIGKSIVLSYGFDDNYYLEKSIDTDEINFSTINNEGTINWTKLVDTGGLPTKQYAYTDDNGEIIASYAMFVSNIKVIPAVNNNAYKDPENNEYIDPSPDEYVRQKFQYYCYLKPQVLDTSIYDENTYEEYNYTQLPFDYRQFSTVFYRHKDSQELLKLSTQFEFCSETKNICFTDEFIKRQKATYMLNNSVDSMKAYMYNKNRYDPSKPNELPSGSALEELSVAIKANNYNDYTGADTTSTHISIIFTDHPQQTQIGAVEYAQRYAKDYCFYLRNNDGYSTYNLIAFSEVPMANCVGETIQAVYYPAVVIRLNLLATRNKYVYEKYEPYLINSKLDEY